MSRYVVWAGEFSVTQKAWPEGSRSVCQPRPGPTSVAPSCCSRRTSRGRSSVPWSRWARTGPVGSSRRWKSSCSGEPASSCHLPANSGAGESGPPPGQQAAPEGHLRVVCLGRRVDADLYQASVVSTGPGGGPRCFVISGLDHAEGKPARRQQCPPPPVLSDERGAQTDGVVHGHGWPVALEVDVDARRTADLL